jgi:tetratricopeptide (TPR) repeat protein
LIQLLNKWALTLYYLGSFRIIEQLFEKHKKDAEALGDQSLLGMYYIWLGMGLYGREKIQKADCYFSDSLKIGRKIDDEQVIAYALTWLCWSRVDLGKLDDVTVFATEARERSNFDFADDYPYYKSTGGEGLACFMAGNSRKNKELGEKLLKLGTQKSQIRSLTLGHVSLGYSHDCDGNFPLAIESYKRATKVAKDPMYEQYSRVFLAISLLQNGQLNESQEAFEEVRKFCDKQGFEAIGNPAKFYLGFIQILNGQMSKGMKNIETILQRWIEIDRKPILGLAYLSLGKLYAQIASGTESVSLKLMFKNIGFIIKNVPSATRKAEEYLFQAIEYTENINALGLKAQSLLELGLLYKRKGKKEEAIKYLKEAIEIFNTYDNYVFLEQAQSELESF